MNEYLMVRIKEKSDRSRLSLYIIDSLNYVGKRKRAMFDLLCNGLTDLLDNYGLNFKTVNETSYYSGKDNLIAINERDISHQNQAAFIHELTHAIHCSYYSYEVPDEYEETRESRVETGEFKETFRDLMKVIVEMKKYIYRQFSERHPIDIGVECKNIIYYDKLNKIDNLTYIIDKKDDFYKKMDYKENDIFINIYGRDTYNFYKQSEELNKKFEEIVDNVRLGPNEKPDQIFFVLTALEGMIDSLLLGNLLEGYHNNCWRKNI